MIRNITNTIVGIMLLTPACVAIAGETGMSYDGTGNPGDPPPHIAPPGGGDSPKPLSTNTTPIPSLGGGAQPQARNLPREVQPGEETPQTDDNTAGSGGLRPPRGVMLQPGGGDGTQTEDELYVGRKAGGGSVSSGDEDEFEDLEIERRTVQGVEKPGAPSKSSSQGLQPGGGDGTQTEDELYVGKKAAETPLDNIGQTPAATPPGLPGSLSESTKIRPTQSAPAALIKPAAPRQAPTRQNWGTVWTGYIDDPNADVNPCQKGLERGDQLQVKTYKSGDTTRYDVNYQCYLLVPAPRPAVASTTPRKKCGTVWTGWIDDPDAEVNPCSKGCEPGEQQIVDAGINGGVKQYNVRYQCYVAAPKLTTGSPPASQSGTAPTTTEPHPVSGTPQGARVEGGETASSTSAMKETESKAKKRNAVKILPLKATKEM